MWHSVVDKMTCHDLTLYSMWHSVVDKMTCHDLTLYFMWHSVVDNSGQGDGQGDMSLFNKIVYVTQCSGQGDM